jgi:hypothetical protein
MFLARLNGSFGRALLQPDQHHLASILGNIHLNPVRAPTSPSGLMRISNEPYREARSRRLRTDPLGSIPCSSNVWLGFAALRTLREPLLHKLQNLELEPDLRSQLMLKSRCGPGKIQD